MQEINSYMLKSREERRAHLNLKQECFEIGGNSSVEFKALLAYHLKTMIPMNGQGRQAMVCHACNNPKCSNVNHLYWGNSKDNARDAIECGARKNHYQNTLQKYGVDGMKEIAKKAGVASSITKQNRSKDHFEQFRHAFDSVDLKKRGWAGIVSAKLSCSTTHVYRIARKLNILTKLI